MEHSTTTVTSVYINWSAPNAHSSTITEYDVRFLTSTGLYLATTSCDGTVQAVKDDTECTVPMTEIIALTSLSRDTVIRVKVRAKNGVNWGEYSELNTDGATIETVPLGSSSISFDLTRTTNIQTVV